MHVISILVPQAPIWPRKVQKSSCWESSDVSCSSYTYIFKLDTLSKLPCDKWKAEPNSEAVSNWEILQLE